jgi:hypothetical protein
MVPWPVSARSLDIPEIRKQTAIIALARRQPPANIA